jgi:hypothetical protein
MTYRIDGVWLLAGLQNGSETAEARAFPGLDESIVIDLGIPVRV